MGKWQYFEELQQDLNVGYIKFQVDYRSLPGVVAHVCHPSTQKWRQEDQELKASLGLHGKFKASLSSMWLCLKQESKNRN